MGDDDGGGQKWVVVVGVGMVGGGAGTDADRFLGCKCPLVVIQRTTPRTWNSLSCVMFCHQVGRAEERHSHHGLVEGA